MQRDCLEKIAEWNNSRKRKPLVLMGARQVGKTWLMEEFAKQSYPGKHVVVNFMRQRSLSDSIQESDIDPQKLIRLIQAATGRRVIPGETLLILDELQECPRALTSLKFFNEDMPELAVMAAGSLLGLAWGKSNGDKPQAGDSDAVYSFPVGKVNRLNVYPMTFAEFLKAIGVEGKAMVVTSAVNENIVLSARNIPGVQTTIATILSTYDVMNVKSFIVDKAALAKIEEVYA